MANIISDEERCELLRNQSRELLEQRYNELNSKLVEEMNLSEERRQIIESLTIENIKLQKRLENRNNFCTSQIKSLLELINNLYEELEELTVLRGTDEET